MQIQGKREVEETQNPLKFNIIGMGIWPGLRKNGVNSRKM
jgi:hypothetical protein